MTSQLNGIDPEKATPLLRRPMKRSPYALIGFSLAVLKFLGDFLIVTTSGHTKAHWSPFEYLNTSNAARFGVLHTGIAVALLAWMLPFVVVGVICTVRRALDAGWSPWWALIFFVPYLNYLLMLTFCLWPSSEKYALTDPRFESGESEESFPNAKSLGVLAGLAVCLAMIWISIGAREIYATSLFVGTPVAMGAIAGYFASRKSATSVMDMVGLCLMLNFLAGILIVAVKFDGAICVVMAFPFSFVLSLAGAFLGRAIARGGRAIRRSAASALMLLPVCGLVEPANLVGNTQHFVRTSIEVNAPPEKVWPHLSYFQPIEPPRDAMFRVGIAYPTGTHTALGGGVGAARYCGFSTGEVVERITAWEINRRVAFDVISQPAPMVELSPYKDLDPPHLHGYVKSKTGEFRLVPLPNGRTRIEGTSTYELHMAPEAYWSMWVDWSVHAIHRRVLEHIKEEVEAGK